MANDVRASLKYKRETNEGFKKRYEQNKRSKFGEAAIRTRQKGLRLKLDTARG